MQAQAHAGRLRLAGRSSSGLPWNSAHCQALTARTTIAPTIQAVRASHRQPAAGRCCTLGFRIVQAGARWVPAAIAQPAPGRATDPVPGSRRAVVACAGLRPLIEQGFQGVADLVALAATVAPGADRQQRGVDRVDRVTTGAAGIHLSCPTIPRTRFQSGSGNEPAACRNRRGWCLPAAAGLASESALLARSLRSFLISTARCCLQPAGRRAAVRPLPGPGRGSAWFMLAREPSSKRRS